MYKLINSVARYKVDSVARTRDFNHCDCVPAGRGSRGGCMRCQQSRSLQLAVKILYGFVAFLVIVVAVLASLGEHQHLPQTFTSVKNGSRSSGSTTAKIPCCDPAQLLPLISGASCSQHSFDLLANSTGSRRHQERGARRGGAGRGAGDSALLPISAPCRSNVVCSCTFYLTAAQRQQMLFALT